MPKRLENGHPHADHTTRDRLLDSARRFFAERGYQGTSVRDIIEDAGVTRPVFVPSTSMMAPSGSELIETRVFSHGTTASSSSWHAPVPIAASIASRMEEREFRARNIGRIPRNASVVSVATG